MRVHLLAAAIALGMTGVAQATTYQDIYNEAINGDLAADGSTFTYMVTRPGSYRVAASLPVGDTDTFTMIFPDRRKLNEFAWGYLVIHRPGLFYQWNDNTLLFTFYFAEIIGDPATALPYEVFFQYNIAPIPLPAAAPLLLAGLGALLIISRSKGRASRTGLPL